MISVTELRAGTNFLLDGQPYQVVKYTHSKIGRGTANIKVRVKNLGSGAVLEKTFTSGAKVEPIEVERKRMQYLYREGEMFYFMDPASFEQSEIDAKTLKEQGKYLKEGSQVNILYSRSKPLSLELPISLVFKVEKTDPGIKGDSATNIWKEAVLENKMAVKVPLFIKAGDLVKVDTRTGEYLSRESK